MPTCHDVATARKASSPTRSAGSDCETREASSLPTRASAGGATNTSATPTPTAPAVDRSTAPRATPRTPTRPAAPTCSPSVRSTAGIAGLHATGHGGEDAGRERADRPRARR